MGQETYIQEAQAQGRLDSNFKRRAASLLRAAANDLKRDDESADRDLGLTPGTFAACVSGRKPVTWELIRKAARVWPLNERDLLPSRDDCPEGIRIHRFHDSVESSRVLARGGADYYEYRDTAMSRAASYRPEWIRMLRIVEDYDPYNPLVQWNHGHLLYQFTYFVGPVNYYYRWGDELRCVPMTTGDSVWGLPFAPHSFTARSDEEPAYILALTYGGDLVGDAQRELAVLGNQVARDLSLPVESGPEAQSRLLRSFLAARATTVSEVADRARMSTTRSAQIFEGCTRPTPAELESLAQALGVSLRDLMPPRTRTELGITIQHADSAHQWAYPDSPSAAYHMRELAGDPLHPHTSALEIEVLASEFNDANTLVTYQHQYVYVLGEGPVRVEWEHAGKRQSEELQGGDSLYVKPQISLRLAAFDGTRPRILLLRIAGNVSSDVRFAMGAMAGDGIDRYVAEDRLWYTKGEGENV